MDNMSVIKDHILQSLSVKEKILENNELLKKISDVAEKQVACLRNGNKIFFAGNGGSAADAQHLSAEYVSKLKRDRDPLAAIALSTDTSALTAIGNDYGFEQLFARQVRALGKAGDVFVGISTSGNSSNIVNAFAAAKDLGIYTIALLGGGDGRCEKLADTILNVPSHSTASIQECHIMLGHIICALVESEMFFD